MIPTTNCWITEIIPLIRMQRIIRVLISLHALELFYIYAKVFNCFIINLVKIMGNYRLSYSDYLIPVHLSKVN